MDAGTEISLYLIRNLGALLLLVIVMRGILHASRVNFYNPFSQIDCAPHQPVANAITQYFTGQGPNRLGGDCAGCLAAIADFGGHRLGSG